MSKITGKEYPISDIFTSKFEYHIPSYQRPYAWEKEQAETLFDDLLDFYKNQPKDDNYFLGCIVLIKEDDENKPLSYVIDGQQRLTTLTILLSVIASFFEDPKLRSEIEEKILEPGKIFSGLKPQPRLFLRDKDQEFFERYIQEGRVNDLLSLNLESPIFDTEAKKHIRINSQAFKDRLEKSFETGSDEFKKFIGFILTRCYLISVMTPSQTSAFRVFSVMNSRGLDLLPIDIFKADIIGEVAANHQNAYTQKWEDMENTLTRQGFNELFVHIRMIYAKEKLREELVSNFKKAVITKIQNSEDFIDKVLSPYCEAYDIIRKCNYTSTSDKAKQINDTLRWLNKGFNYDWIPATLKFMLKYGDDPDYLLWFLKKMEHLAACLVPLARKINSAAQNYDFPEKKEKYFTNSRTGTTSYNLTSQVLLMPAWTEDVVEKRQKELLDIFKKNWEL